MRMRPSVSGRTSFHVTVYKRVTVYLTELAVELTWPSLYSAVTGLLMSPFFLFESPWLLCAATVRALRVLALWNTVNYSTVVDQSDYSISTILYNNRQYCMCMLTFYMHYIGVSVVTTRAYGHTTLNAPVLVRSPKLSSVGPAQYLDGWPPGNSRCCRLRFLFFFFFLLSL